MLDITYSYFSDLFYSSSPSIHDIQGIIELLDPVVNDIMNDSLCEKFTAEEVHKAVFDMHPSKAPGPDGFTAMFYQKLWPVVGEDIIAAVILILNEQVDISECNSTLITLFPKVKEPMTLKEFRPISLCNTCYKIVSRAITNQFRPIDQVIDSFQSAFVPGRLSLDNVIVGFGCMHRIRNNRKAKSGFAALKLDMSKAYNRVE